MPLVQFFGGPWDSQLREVRKLDPVIKFPRYRKPVMSPPLFDERIADLHLETGRYDLHRLSYAVCCNVLFRWFIDADVYVDSGYANKFKPGQIKPQMWQHRFELQPAPDFLTQFEDWFLFTAYWVGAKCRQVRRLETEVFDAMERAQRFVGGNWMSAKQYYGDPDDDLENYLKATAMVILPVDPFGVNRYQGKR